MSDIIKLFTSGGAGDALFAANCAHFVYKANHYPYIHVCSRNAVFEPLQYLLKGIHCLHQQEEWVWEKLLNDENFYNSLKNHPNDEVYLDVPDNQFRHPHSFDYKKYNTNPTLIRTTRILTEKYRPDFNLNLVYVSLASNTEGYLYSNIGGLLRQLGKNLPHLNFFFPKITKWDNKDIEYGNLENMPSNVEIKENPSFIECIDLMYRSIFNITTCCGPLHIFQNLGTEQLILDPRFEQPGWWSRWRAFPNNSIPIQSSIGDVVNLTKILFEIPESRLIPRQHLQNLLIKNKNIEKELLLKF